MGGRLTPKGAEPVPGDRPAERRPDRPAERLPDGPAEGGSEARPLIERVGLGLIAVIIAVVFGALAVGAFASGEVFLGTMAGIGALMTVWAAGSTLRR